MDVAMVMMHSPMEYLNPPWPVTKRSSVASHKWSILGNRIHRTLGNNLH